MRKTGFVQGSPASSTVSPNQSGITPIWYGDFSNINSFLEGFEPRQHMASFIGHQSPNSPNSSSPNLLISSTSEMAKLALNNATTTHLLAAAGANAFPNNAHQSHLQNNTSASNLHSLNLQDQVNLLTVAGVPQAQVGGHGRKKAQNNQRGNNVAHNTALAFGTAVAFPGAGNNQQQVQFHTNGNGRQDQHLLAQSHLPSSSNSVSPNTGYLNSWPCPACKICFRSPNDLQSHLSTTHLNNGPNGQSMPIKGNAGGHFDNQSANLGGNIQSNFQDPKKNGTKKEKSVPCNECGKLFTSAERVRVHVRVAHGEKTCACEICGCGFSYRCKLMNHMRTHTGDKPFNCEVCGRSFSQKNHLKRHHMIHTGERPFPCMVCGRSFYRKDKLARHQKVHTNPGGGGGRGRKANNANAATNAAAAAAAANNANNAVNNAVSVSASPVTALNLLSPNTAAAAAVAAAASNKMAANQSLTGLIGAGSALPLFPASMAQIRNGVDTSSSNWVTHLVDGRAALDVKDGQANGLSLTARRD